MMQATRTLLLCCSVEFLNINDENMFFRVPIPDSLHWKFIGRHCFSIVTCFLLHGFSSVESYWIWRSHNITGKNPMKVMTKTTWQDLVQLPTNPWGCRAKSCVANRLAIPRLFAPRSVLRSIFVGWKNGVQYGNQQFDVVLSKGKKLFGSRRPNWRTLHTRWEKIQRGEAGYRFERPIIAGIPNASNVQI